MLAIIPVFFIEEVYERFSWGYFETFKKLFSYKHRKLLLSYGADGAQMAVATVFWPIFIFTLFDEKYAAVGFITSLSMVFILMLNAWLGHMVEHWGHEKVLKVGTTLEVTGWFMKAFVVTPFHVFVTDTYHKLGDSVIRFSKDFASYRHMADNGHYIDEYTTLAEMSFRLGKIVMLVISAAIIGLFDIRFVFIFTAIVSVLFLLFKDKLILFCTMLEAKNQEIWRIGGKNIKKLILRENKKQKKRWILLVNLFFLVYPSCLKMNLIFF
jgi:hypothetical protein